MSSGVPPGVSIRANVTISPEAAERITDLEAADETSEGAVEGLTTRLETAEAAVVDFETRIAALENA